MDRFIATSLESGSYSYGFKIQYGQIYREPVHPRNLSDQDLKSNMDRFIDTRKNKMPLRLI